MQTAITIIIVAVAAAYTAYRIIGFLRKPEDHACSPDKCASCPMAKDGCTPVARKK